MIIIPLGGVCEKERVRKKGRKKKRKRMIENLE